MLEKLRIVQEKIKKAAEKSSRRQSDIKLVAVTKIANVEQILEAIGLGVYCIGESRIQDAEAKFSQLPEIEKHMIGTLQTNKVKKAVKLFDVIQSVDSFKLAEEINKQAFGINKIMPVFIEVNITGEESKHGVSPRGVASFYDKLVKLLNLRVEGLMTIAPYVKPDETRPYFRQMKGLFDELRLKYLSMGMSNDFEIAIEEGSNMVRIGRAIFG